MTSNWYLNIGDSDLEQIVYRIEKPKGRFPEGSKTPEFDPVTIEIPTRIMLDTEKWIMDEDCICDLKFKHRDLDNDRIMDKFTLKDAHIFNHVIKPSAIMNITTISIIIKYNGVENATL